MPRRHELTVAQWETIRDLLHGKEEDPGWTAVDDRLSVNAVLFILKTGIPWEDLPGQYGKPNMAWQRFDRWCAAGVWNGLPGPWEIPTPKKSTSIRPRSSSTHRLNRATAAAGKE